MHYELQTPHFHRKHTGFGFLRDLPRLLRHNSDLFSPSPITAKTFESFRSSSCGRRCAERFTCLIRFRI
ncbi:hypothetical protein ASZ90_010142 [hydrocarbon metagenome]|uniref:Uncharacterized protein n=1 Tax=hydrocarbon metagenome TaxID=938273 RepID=A0A0W8FGU7_9ZZZZ